MSNFSYSYGNASNVGIILNMEILDSERVNYFLFLANKRISTWSGLDLFDELEEETKDAIAELYAAYLYKLSTASVSGRLPEDLEWWKKEALEMLESELISASKPYKIKFSK
ncbi:MAG: hypothetical protein QIT35_gp25 [Methanophagales virus PBV299]|uniref:Uncharacterized protein n=1 Tax=Methanophagales virus PBV299 TaxID=2987730 RepID=A0ABY6GLD6_9CAUD|nr:MAG: hypothetical protein QIT35_gp25 [Methanophagales virus PBV299]UYL64821.1 MAG: hypothetical protein OFDIEDLO_00025 [Methanophagales virus PBV299]